ncbi:PAQR family membrane homeostasis protein TrhA [Bdellovibrio sp. HCB288]|uniref:PAQR family membrane homeostasis protein TrhA n=1 Tax=Bdellovibrio sp. HCB288 TaxID=3394355 RepID=UPI0039B41B44
MERLLSVQHGEKFNTFSHLLGALIAFVGVAFLMHTAFVRQDIPRIITFTIYGVSTVLIYVLSVLYHSAQGEQKRTFQKLDYIGIYFKIAGNYTPYMILAISGVAGYSVLLVVWGLALLGIYLEVFRKPKGATLRNILYVTMSASVIPVLTDLYQAVSMWGFTLIMVGFLAYVIGFIFFLFDEKIKHGHGIWHMFVITGSMCQLICLLMFVA